MKYFEKLKDPRWQKKRLEILQRDDWKCACCGNSENTLHVHHRVYWNKTEPWDYPENLLVTLCEDCHEIEGAERSSYEHDLIAMLKEKFLAPEVFDLMHGFYCLELQDTPSIVSGSIEYLLKTPELQKELINKYLDHKKGIKNAP